MNQPAMDNQKILQNGNHPHVPVIKVKKLSEYAIMPTRAPPPSTGYDLSSAANLIIPARETGCVPTDLIIALPNNSCGAISGRTGYSLALGQSIVVGTEVIQPSSRSPVEVIIHNHSDANLHLYLGDKIARLVVAKVLLPEVVQVSNF